MFRSRKVQYNQDEENVAKVALAYIMENATGTTRGCPSPARVLTELSNAAPISTCHLTFRLFL
jgi:hypothetical protein